LPICDIEFFCSGFVKVTFILHDSQEKTVDANIGDTILDIIEEHGIPLIYSCRGAGVCGSCRVKIENASGKIEPAEGQELNILEMFQFGDDIRLACQVTLTQASDGLRIVLI
jgi:2Fe-2S ferredoxin